MIKDADVFAGRYQLQSRAPSAERAKEASDGTYRMRIEHSAWAKRLAFSIHLMMATSVVADEAAPDKSNFTLLDPTPDTALRSFNTDRPPKANSPYTVDAGHFQYETDLVVYSNGSMDGVKTQDWTVPDPTLKLGLTNTIDAELQVSPYASVATKGGGDRTTASGIGNTIARLKINVLGDDHGTVSVALLPYFKLPTAASGLGNGKIEGGFILPLSIVAEGGFTVIVMPEGDYLKNAVGAGYHAALDLLINVNHPLGTRWTGYTEIFTSQFFSARNVSIYTLDAAVTYSVTSNLQLDLGPNCSLNNVSPRRQLYTGLSQRF